MNQADYPPNNFKPGSQTYRIYERLRRYGRVLNWEIMLGLGGDRILKYTGRLSEVRDYLERNGITIHCKPVNGGTFEYRIGRNGDVTQ
jgi:hypothetical protein